MEIVRVFSQLMPFQVRYILKCEVQRDTFYISKPYYKLFSGTIIWKKYHQVYKSISSVEVIVPVEMYQMLEKQYVLRSTIPIGV